MVLLISIQEILLSQGQENIQLPLPSLADLPGVNAVLNFRQDFFGTDHADIPVDLKFPGM